MWERRGVHRILAGKPEGKKPLGRPRRRWEGNIKMAIQEVGCKGMDWLHTHSSCPFYLPITPRFTLQAISSVLMYYRHIKCKLKRVHFLSIHSIVFENIFAHFVKSAT